MPLNDVVRANLEGLQPQRKQEGVRDWDEGFQKGDGLPLWDL